jgi:deoxycytidylate deaminase
MKDSKATTTYSIKVLQLSTAAEVGKLTFTPLASNSVEVSAFNDKDEPVRLPMANTEVQIEWPQWADGNPESPIRLNRARARQYWQFMVDHNRRCRTLKAEDEALLKAPEQLRIPERAEVVSNVCTCPKCKGTGKLERYEHIANGKCFTCKGTGLVHVAA